MSLNSPTQGHARRAENMARQIAAGFSRLEAFGGMAIVGMICFTVSITAFYVVLTPSHGTGDPWSLQTALILVAIAEVVSFTFLFRCSQSGSFPLRRLPHRQWHFPLFLRPVAAAWWLGHFIGISIGVHLLFPKLGLDHTMYEKIVLRALGIFALACVEFSSNAYLILGVAALTGNLTVNRAVYRFRLVVDLAAAIVMAQLPTWSGH